MPVRVTTNSCSAWPLKTGEDIIFGSRRKKALREIAAICARAAEGDLSGRVLHLKQYGALVEETMASAQSLAGLAAKLSEVVRFFQLQDDPPLKLAA